MRAEGGTWQARSLFSVKGDQVSVRTQNYRLDTAGRLFHIPSDRGQRHNVATQHPEMTAHLARQAEQHRRSMQAHFRAHADRPFTVGFAASTTLPARDGVPHGTIQRSSKAPNNSFFTNWTRTDDSITWDIEVGTTGNYDAVL